MTYRFHQKLKNLKPYEVVSEECRIRLDANESFLNPGKELSNQIIEAISKIELNRYPDDSCRELRRAFGSYFGVEPERVVAGNGSDELISLLIGSFLQPDETLLFFEPEFSMYRIFAEAFNRNFITIHKSDDMKMPSEQVIGAIHESGARVVIFSNPSSPSSKVMARSEVCTILESTDALIVVDEAYMDFSDQSVLDLTLTYENLIVLKTCSKAFGCAAIRLGFAVASDKIISILNALRPPYNVNSISQAIGTLVLSHHELIKSHTALIIMSREELYHGLKTLVDKKGSIKIFPSETNFIYLITNESDQIYEKLKSHSILVRNMDHALRITVGTKEENDQLLRAMEEILTTIQ
jgi:histidinol-phosphate aminotransferase